MNYLQFLFCHYTFLSYFNLSVNLYTFKILNPYTYWKSLSFTNFSFFFFFLWVKSFSLVFILLFNDTLMKSLFVNLVTKHVTHVRLTLILSLFTLCIRKVKIMLISLKYHVLSPQIHHSFSIFFFSKLKCFGNRL